MTSKYIGRSQAVVANQAYNKDEVYTKAESDANYLPIDAETLPDQDTHSGKFLTTDGTYASWAEVNTDLVSDLSPQLGADLDLNNHNITGPGQIGSTVLETPTFLADGSTMSSGTYNYILKGVNNTGNALVVFANGSARTADNGVNTTTIRNDIGPLVLGSGGNYNLAALPATPFMVVEHNNGARTYADGTNNVYYNQIRHARGGVGHNNNYNFTFTHPGYYRITTTYRYGTGGDVWTSMRFVNSTSVLGQAHGTGQIGNNDPATNVFDYVVPIDSSNVGVNLQQQFQRAGSGFSISNTGLGYELITVVQWIGRI